MTSYTQLNSTENYGRRCLTPRIVVGQSKVGKDKRRQRRRAQVDHPASATPQSSIPFILDLEVQKLQSLLGTVFAYYRHNAFHTTCDLVSDCCFCGSI